MKNKVLIFIIIFLFFLVIFPLLKPGYIFAIDQILIFNGDYPKIGDNIFWLIYLGNFINFLGIPSWIFEKIIILISFFAPILGGYLLTKDTKNNYSIIFCCFLLIFNPFFYGRFIDGQINVYLSYAFYPLFFYFLKNTLEKNNLKNIFILGFFTLFLCLTSLHNTIFLFFIFIIFFIFYFKNTGIKFFLKIFSVIFLVNLIWFIPLFLEPKEKKSELFKQSNNFGIENREVFSSKSGGINIYFKNISMNGYWGENQKRFMPVYEQNKVWFLIFLMIFSLSFIGFYNKNSEKKLSNFDKSMLTLFLTSIIFGFGISEKNIFSFINNFMYEYFPMYSGMREPHKWIMFLPIIYAYFGAFGIKFFSKKIEKIDLYEFNKKLILYFLAFLPIFYVPKTLFGFYGQISISNFPSEWKEIKEIYNEKYFSNNCKYLEEKKSEKCYKSLIFPWHGYINISFTKKVVGSWIFNYFGQRLLYGDNIEIGGIYTLSTRPESKIIEKYIGPKNNFLDDIKIQDLKNFYEDLKGLGIEYLFFFKESDFKRYEIFFEKSLKKGFIKEIRKKDTIIIYEILK